MKLTGQILRQAREQRNITINEVSFTTKINVRVLQAMEEGDLDHCPTKTFLRGFVRSYAEYLKLDVASVLAQFQEEMGSTKPVLETTSVGPGSENQLGSHAGGGPTTAISMGSGTNAGERRSDSAIKPPRPVASSAPRETAEDEINAPSNSTMKVMIGVVGVLVVIVGYFVQRTIQKYENEKVSVVTPAPGNVTGTTPTPTLPDLDSALAPVVAVSPQPNAVPSVVPTHIPVAPTVGPSPIPTMATATPKPSTSPTAVPTSIPTAVPTVTPKPTIAPTISPKPSPAVTPIPRPVPSITPPAPKVKLNPNAIPQEVIVEAIDAIAVRVQVDGGRTQTINLGRDQIHTFKAKDHIQLDINNGGAANVIHNGVDLGVQGTMGQPKTLKYP